MSTIKERNVLSVKFNLVKQTRTDFQSEVQSFCTIHHNTCLYDSSKTCILSDKQPKEIQRKSSITILRILHFRASDKFCGFIFKILIYTVDNSAVNEYLY